MSQDKIREMNKHLTAALFLVLSAIIGIESRMLYHFHNQDKLRRQCINRQLTKPDSADTISKFFGLPTKYKHPSLNAYIAYYYYKVNECVSNKKAK